MSTGTARSITSVIGGSPVTTTPVDAIGRSNPAHLDDVVAEVSLADAATFVEAARAARAAPARLGARPAAGARPGDRTHRPAGRGQHGGARRARDAARSASRSPRPAARCRRSSTPATSSSARAAGCTARRCRARCRTSSCSPSARRSGWPPSSPPATSRSPCRRWYLVPALLCGNAVVWKPAEYAAALGAGVLRAVRARRRSARRRAQRRPRRRPGDVRRASRTRWTPGWSTRSASPARPRSARGSASCAAGTCSRRASSSAARTRWWCTPTPTSPWPWRARCSPASARPGSAARRSAR